MPSGGGSAATYHQQEKNPILQLNDIRKDCVYELVDDQGATPEKKFSFKLTIDGKTFFGSGPTKKAAKAASAAKALKHPAVNDSANKYKEQKVQKQNYNANKQAFYGKKATKGYQDRIANSNQESKGYQYINGKKVCRFYLNSLCLRGKNCPYLHPEYSSAIQNNPSLFPQVPLKDNYTWLQFCDNYMHLRCPHSDCKFLHVSRDDEEIYLASGKVPPHIVEQAVRKALADEGTPGFSPCKAYLEGQCSWYSCPFRHVSRKDFSQEVLETLYKHFERRLRPRDDYHMLSRRLLDSPSLDREHYGYSSRSSEFVRRILDEPPLGYESRFSDMRDYRSARPLSSDPSMLVKGMSNLMRDDNYRQEKELRDLRDELRSLHEENAMLRNSYRLRSAEEDNVFRRGVPRSDFHDSEKMYQDQLRRLRNENEDIRRMLLAREGERQRPCYPLEHRSGGNPILSEGFFADMRPDMRRQNPEMHNFDELLDSGIRRMENQIRYKRLGVPTSLTTPNYQVPQAPQQVLQQIVKQQHQQQQQKQMYNKPRMPGKATQAATRPSYHVNKKSNSAQSRKRNQQQNKRGNKFNPQQKQQQKQKTLPLNKEQKLSANSSDKDRPVVTIEREKLPRQEVGVERDTVEGQASSEENVVVEEVVNEEAAAVSNQESKEEQSGGKSEESEQANQDSTSENEDLANSPETEEESNVTSENEEKSSALSD